MKFYNSAFALLVIASAPFHALAAPSAPLSCLPGDPLCDRIETAISKGPAIKANKKPAKAEKTVSSTASTKSDRRPHAVTGPSLALTDETKASSQASQPRTPLNLANRALVDTQAANGDQTIVMGDDNLNADCLGGNGIKAPVPHKLVPFSCYDYYMGPVLNRFNFDRTPKMVVSPESGHLVPDLAPSNTYSGSLHPDDFQGSLYSDEPAALQKAYQNVIQCLDSCLTDADAAFLSSCQNMAQVIQKSKGDPSWVFETDHYVGCPLIKVIEAVAVHGLLSKRRNPSTGRCEDWMTHPYKVGNRTDVVLMIDNSEGMKFLAQSVLHSALPAILSKLQEKFQDARIILTTHNIGGETIVLDASDPELTTKVESAANKFFEKVGDENERPLEAMVKNLKGKVRPDANIYSFIITDEKDKSPGPPTDYLAALNVMTKGDVYLSSSAPGKNWFAATHSLDDAAAISHGMVIDPFEGFEAQVNQDERLKRVFYADKVDKGSSNEITSVHVSNEDTDYFNQKRSEILAGNIARGLGEKLGPSLDSSLPKPKVFVTPGADLSLVYVKLNGRLLARNEYSVDPNTREIVFAQPLNYSQMNQVEVSDIEGLPLRR